MNFKILVLSCCFLFPGLASAGVVISGGTPPHPQFYSMTEMSNILGEPQVREAVEYSPYTGVEALSAGCYAVQSQAKEVYVKTSYTAIPSPGPIPQTLLEFHVVSLEQCLAQ